MEKIKRDEIEIMAPVGCYESLAAAVQAGADSIYFGVEQLNMRARSSFNFTLDDLARIVATARENGIRTYLTVNTILYDEDLPEMRRILDRARREGVDAVIASDQAAIFYARSIGLEVHISTQLNVSNIESVAFYAQYADVVVLARELSLAQVQAIRRGILERDIRGPHGKPVKIEMFAHGALCMAISGKCYLSLHHTNCSANRGSCRQICRRAYEVRDKDTGEELEIENHYIMSPKDLCTVDFLDRFLEAGVRVLKIEGRARSAEYVKRVVECYDEALRAIEAGRGMEAAAADRIQPRFLGRVLPRRTGRTVEQSLRVVRHDAQGVRRQGNELLLPDRRSGDPGRSGSAGSRRGSFHHRRDDRSVGIHGRRHPGSPEIRRTGSSGRLLFRKNPFAGTTRG